MLLIIEFCKREVGYCSSNQCDNSKSMPNRLPIDRNSAKPAYSDDRPANTAPRAGSPRSVGAGGGVDTRDYCPSDRYVTFSIDAHTT